MDFNGLFAYNLECIFPEFFLVISISLLLVYGAGYGTRSVNSKGNPIILNGVLCLCSLILFLAAFLSFHSIFKSGPTLYGSLYLDSLTINAKGLTYFAAGLSLVSSRAYLIREGIYAFEYPILVVLSALGMGLLLSSYDLLALYLPLELQALALYVLASFKRGSAYSTEAGLKYFVVGAFSSGLLLFGLSLIYIYTGTTNLEALNRLLIDSGSNISMGVYGGLLFVSAGLLFKLAASPFHMWIPDVYEGSPSSSALFFAVVPKLSIFVTLIRLYYVGFYDLFFIWQPILLTVSLLSLLFATIGALYQRKLKRFLAYSSIGHVGYVLIALATVSPEGIQAVLTYLIIYMAISLNAWTSVLVLLRNIGKEGGNVPVKYIDELVHLSRINPALTASFAFLALSMAGIPPLAGFAAKLGIFFSAISVQLYMVSIIGVLLSVVSAFYYLRWLKLLYFDQRNPSTTNDSFVYRVSISQEQGILLATTGFFLLFYFADAGPLQTWMHITSLSLFL